MRKNLSVLPAPSISAASYRDAGICFKAERKINMEEPNCHTTRKISTQIAVLVSPSQDFSQGIPTACSNRLITPSMANILFHNTATATDPPITEGK